MRAFTPGPWGACIEGKCQCKFVSCGDHPICKVEAGEWGDEYPALRIKGESSLDQTVEPYTAMIAYGSIAEETAQANARLIAASPDLHYLVESFYEEGHKALFSHEKWMAHAKRVLAAVEGK